MAFLLGIEGGVSKSTIMLAQADGTIVDSWVGGSINAYGKDREQAQQNLFKLIIHVLERNNVHLANIKAVGIGSATLASAREQLIMRQFLRDIGLQCPVALKDDAIIALLAGCKKQEGMILKSSTGSIAIGYDGSGNCFRIGGWGYLYDDTGSAYMIGKEALAAAVQYYDGRGPATCLLDMILEELKVSQLKEIIPMLVVAEHRERIASLAPLIDIACQKGDQIAKQIQDEAVLALYKHVEVLLKKLDFMHTTPQLFCFGAVLLNNNYIFDNVKRKILHFNSTVTVHRLKQSPAYGAVVLAQKILL